MYSSQTWSFFSQYGNQHLLIFHLDTLSLSTSMNMSIHHNGKFPFGNYHNNKTWSFMLSFFTILRLQLLCVFFVFFNCYGFFLSPTPKFLWMVNWIFLLLWVSWKFLITNINKERENILNKVGNRSQNTLLRGSAKNSPI